MTENKQFDGRITKLYDIPKESILELGDDDGSVVFHYLDGMYSYCTNREGQVLNLKVTTPLEQIGVNHYKILWDKK